MYLRSVVLQRDMFKELIRERFDINVFVLYTSGVCLILVAEIGRAFVIHGALS